MKMTTWVRLRVTKSSENLRSVGVPSCPEGPIRG